MRLSFVKKLPANCRRVRRHRVSAPFRAVMRATAFPSAARTSDGRSLSAAPTGIPTPALVTSSGEVANNSKIKEDSYYTF